MVQKHKRSKLQTKEKTKQQDSFFKQHVINCIIKDYKQDIRCKRIQQ